MNSVMDEETDETTCDIPYAVAALEHLVHDDLEEVFLDINALHPDQMYTFAGWEALVPVLQRCRSVQLVVAMDLPTSGQTGEMLTQTIVKIFPQLSEEGRLDVRIAGYGMGLSDKSTML